MLCPAQAVLAAGSHGRSCSTWPLVPSAFRVLKVSGPLAATAGVPAGVAGSGSALFPTESRGGRARNLPALLEAACYLFRCKNMSRKANLGAQKLPRLHGVQEDRSSHLCRPRGAQPRTPDPAAAAAGGGGDSTGQSPASAPGGDAAPGTARPQRHRCSTAASPRAGGCPAALQRLRCPSPLSGSAGSRAEAGRQSLGSPTRPRGAAKRPSGRAVASPSCVCGWEEGEGTAGGNAN